MAILRGSRSAFWRDMLRWSPSAEDRLDVEHARIQGLDRLREALAAGRGVILWESNGFGQKLAARQILAGQGFPIWVVHGSDHLGGFLVNHRQATRVRRRWIRGFFDRCERRWVREIINIPPDGSLAFTRQLRECLSGNQILCCAGDGREGWKLIPRPFLGLTGYFATGMVSLARMTGAVILPLFCLRDAEGEFRLILEEPITVAAGEDSARAAEISIARFAGLLEAYIRRYPEQYWNWHLLGHPPLIPPGAAAEPGHAAA
jgi:KDO2-lipid IV(A) lauroyltransferase